MQLPLQLGVDHLDGHLLPVHPTVVHLQACQLLLKLHQLNHHQHQQQHEEEDLGTAAAGHRQRVLQPEPRVEVGEVGAEVLAEEAQGGGPGVG